MVFVNTSLFIFKESNTFFKLLSEKLKALIKRFNVFKFNYQSVLKEGLIALVICLVGGLLAGLILGKMTYFLEIIPGLLVIIPGSIGLRGNIYGSFSSRLNTNLHIGTLSPKFQKSSILIDNSAAAIILTLLISLFLPIVAIIICIIFNFEIANFVDFILISVLAGIVSTFIMLPVSMFISLKSYENGWDPDNITTPLIAALGDLFTLPSILIGIFIVFFLDNEIVKIVILAILVLIIILSFIYALFKEGEIKKIVSESTPVLLFTSCLGIFSGGFINNSSAILLNNPTLLTLIPLFSGENGNILSILCARLSSALHSGFIDPTLKPQKNTLHNFAIMFIFAIFILPVMTLIVYVSLLLIGVEPLNFIEMLSIIFISGIIVVSIMVLAIYYLSVLSVREGLDPDNIVIPLSTSLTDLASMVTLTSVAIFILSVAIL